MLIFCARTRENEATREHNGECEGRVHIETRPFALAPGSVVCATCKRPVGVTWGDVGSTMALQDGNVVGVP